MHVRLRCLPLLQATLSLLLMSGATVAQAGPIPGPSAITCQNPAVTAQLSVLSGQISEKVQDIANCNPPSGVPACTRAQISAIQATLSKLQSEYEAEFAQCEPAPPPPTQASVGVAGIEVTQVIQDMNESVPLIAGKQTWVRVYLSASGTPSLLMVTGTIQVQSSNGAVVTLSPTAPAQISAVATLLQMRANLGASLNFKLPANLTTGATADTITVATIAVQGGTSLGCLNCRSATQSVTFVDAPPLRLRIVPIQYTDTNGNVITPRAIDYTLLESWLGRAYPTNQVIASIAPTQPTPVPLSTLFTNTAAGCSAVNTFLSTLRTIEEFSFPPFIFPQVDPRTHYYGMVLTDSTDSMLANGGFMRGCSPIGGYVSSGPTGPSSLFPGGDSAQTFGDWYGGHEIGHSFGRAHPGFINSAGVAVGYCGAAGPDTLYPYPNAQISDNQDDLVGLDVGDTTNGIPLAVLDGVSHFDVMSYCALPQWMSDYTYEAILSGPSGLVAEDPSGNGLARSVLVEGRYVSIIASLNLTKKTGKFEFVQTVGAALRVSAPSTTKALLEYVDAAGRPLGRYEVNANFVADADPGEDVTALIDAQIPFVAGAAKLNLYLGDKLLDSRSIPMTPPAIRDLRVAAEGTVTWDATRAPGAVLTYFVQASQDGKNWDVIAMNLSEREFALSPAQRRAYTSVRVFANDGFNSSEPVEVGLRQR